MRNLNLYIKEALKLTADSEIDIEYDTEGVYAYFKDGTLSNDEDYIKKHKKDAIGVAVITKLKDGDFYRIVIDKNDIKPGDGYVYYVYYGGWEKPITGATITKDGKTAFDDMNGEANTIAISKACHECKDNYRTGSAAEDCQKAFNGHGYLPSLGELGIVYDKKDEVEKMMSAIGGDALEDVYYWSSTLYDKDKKSWYFYWNNGKASAVGRLSQYRYVRAVMKI